MNILRSSVDAHRVRGALIAGILLAAVAGDAAAQNTPASVEVATMPARDEPPGSMNPKYRADLSAFQQAMAESDKRSDEAWARALPVVKEWEKKGKPYIPWAAKPDDLPQAAIPAFPGAWGGGMYSFGGRGGRVIVVTSLDDFGPGTLREACETGGPRIVLFNVAGVINLKSRIRVRAPYITIAGQTAPGDGVCIFGEAVEIDTHDVVLRHLRVRRGIDNTAMRNDAVGGNAVGNVIIDHVSASWGSDEVMSIYRHVYLPPDGGAPRKLPTVNVTIQYSTFVEALGPNGHGLGATIGGHNSMFHHNLFACNMNRNPSVGMDGDFGFVNNVIFNWQGRSIDGGDENSQFQIINNYFRPGPATPKDQPISYRVLKPEARRGRDVPKDFGKAYVNGNVVEGYERVTRDNWDGGVQVSEVKDPAATLAAIRVDTPFPMAPVPVQDARAALETVLSEVGATLPRRDAVDARIVEMARTGIVPYPDPTKYIRRISQVGGIPEYKGNPYPDADRDGMPDGWEQANGLNPNDPSDATGDINKDGYMNIEKFLNNSGTKAPVDWKDLKNNRDTLLSLAPDGSPK